MKKIKHELLLLKLDNGYVQVLYTIFSPFVLT